MIGGSLPQLAEFFDDASQRFLLCKARIPLPHEGHGFFRPAFEATE